MTSGVHADLFFTRWVHYQVWRGLFKVEWLLVKDIPNKALNHICNEYNQQKSIPHSRDCTEVNFTAGVEVLKVFENYPLVSCLLDDIDYFEKRESVIADKEKVYNSFL